MSIRHQGAKKHERYLKDIASRIGTTLITLVILFFDFKGCVVPVWKSSDTPTTYAIHGSDGRLLAMIFLPENETITLYTEDKAEFMEAALTKIRGTYGTHYFWRLWRVEGPGTGGGLFGYRICPYGAEQFVMEKTVLKKFIHGSSKPPLRSEGDRTHPVILFSTDAVRFEETCLEKEPTNPELVRALMGKLKP